MTCGTKCARLCPRRPIARTANRSNSIRRNRKLGTSVMAWRRRLGRKAFFARNRAIRRRFQRHACKPELFRNRAVLARGNNPQRQVQLHGDGRGNFMDANRNFDHVTQHVSLQLRLRDTTLHRLHPSRRMQRWHVRHDLRLGARSVGKGRRRPVVRLLLDHSAGR